MALSLKGSLLNHSLNAVLNNGYNSFNLIRIFYHLNEVYVCCLFLFLVVLNLFLGTLSL